MARYATPTVRFMPPSEPAKRYTGQAKVRGVASFNRKRISFTIGAEPWEIPYLFHVINPDGTTSEGVEELCARYEYDLMDVKQFSDTLLAYADFVKRLIVTLGKSGWATFTSDDLLALLKFFYVEFKGWDFQRTNADEIFEPRGIFERLMRAKQAREAQKEK